MFKIGDRVRRVTTNSVFGDAANPHMVAGWEGIVVPAPSGSEDPNFIEFEIEGLIRSGSAKSYELVT